MGCQDVGSGPVGPEGLEPQLAKDKVCPGHPSCKTLGDGGNITATLGLGGGMNSTAPIAVTGMDDSSLIFNTNEFVVDIQMNFTQMNFTTAANCEVRVGTNGVKRGGLVQEVKDYLVAQLFQDPQEPVLSASLGSIHLRINKTDLGSTSDHLLNVSYRGTLGGHSISTQVRYGAFGVEGPTVAVDGNSFEFRGPIMVSAGDVGGRNGKRGRRLIACGVTGENLTTVIVNPTF